MLNNKKHLLLISSAIILLAFVFSCSKENEPPYAPKPPVVPPPISFHETFDSAGLLTAKGWSFKNHSLPIGVNGWRQGRYEPVSLASKLGTTAYIGFPAYRATASPQDFISCDAASVGIEGGTINAWLISPKTLIKNGDTISFYTRSVNDLTYQVFVTDRMQVRANFTDSTDDVGKTATSVGSFTTLLLDINPEYLENDSDGYPYQEWVKYTITISGLAAPVANARFAFRYMGVNAGANGPTYAGVVGVDELDFISK